MPNPSRKGDLKVIQHIHQWTSTFDFKTYLDNVLEATKKEDKEEEDGALGTTLPTPADSWTAGFPGDDPKSPSPVLLMRFPCSALPDLPRGTGSGYLNTHPWQSPSLKFVILCASLATAPC